ncbi:hypothetical protein BpHYR1_031726 [Brachionus plicatilis]|uniref:Uncharacterized protein n=1 Tax=Brachionus plicatilis TaxID=10195 RepID=A0A3M7R2Q8_BRAPC|nr:hypothetical protein BpHYR1_031726 [Brachionus plicatilis]
MSIPALIDNGEIVTKLLNYRLRIANERYHLYCFLFDEILMFILIHQSNGNGVLER